MISKTIKLAGVEDIKTLCNAAVAAPFDIDLLSGNYIIDAKSIMGIFTLDLNRPMSVRMDADEAAASVFLSAIGTLCS